MGVYNVSTISNPEFINLKQNDISPLISSCEIKIMYMDNNRNGSNIKKEVATKMAKTLRGNPIVGYFKEDKDDFRDHGNEITIDEDGFHFNCKTVPYGFVAPDAEVWFQKFSEQDENGNIAEREYLMTTGYLWTGQFPECQRVIDEGRPQSMELDDKSVEGYWAKQKNEDYEFFIINDAIFSKICILGNDVEPCFEGANITAPNISKDFEKTLFTMMNELSFALKSKGEFNLDINENVVKTAGNISQDIDFEKKKSEEEEKEKKSENKDKNEEPIKDEKDKDKEDEKKKYSLLEQKYEELETKFNDISIEYQKLQSFKNDIESKQKDELISSFYMLSDEDKADVIANKDKYSYDEIESKLSVIGYRNKVNFNTQTRETDTKEKPVTTFSCDSERNNYESDILSALRATKLEKEELL